MEYFNIEKVIQAFQSCLLKDDDVLVEEYLKAYEEFNNCLGRAFGFISSDIKIKIDILYALRQDKDSTKAKNFVSFKTMMSYELENGLFKNTKYVSGSRTLLRLHRGLEFLYEFLCGLVVLRNCDCAYACCKTAYECTLGKYHPWVIRKGALIAMYALPTREELFRQVCTDVPRALEALPQMLKNTKIVYDRTESLYTLYNLHHLP